MATHPPYDRRRYRRIDVPIYYRGARLFGSKRTASDLSMGGIRISTDDLLTVGKRIEIELFLAEDVSVTCDVRVAWIRPTPDDPLAKYEAGLEFVGLTPEDAGLLERFLKHNDRKGPPG